MSLASKTLLASLVVLTGCHQLEFYQAVRDRTDPRSADKRRTAVAVLCTEYPAGQRMPYILYYRDMARHDPDVSVRVMAIRALNHCRDIESTTLFIDALKDENEAIRLEAAKALVNMPDPTATTALTTVVSGQRLILTADGHETVVDEDKDVRIAAAEALRNYKTLEVARVLVGCLDETDFGIAWQSRQSLIVLTGKDWKYDQSAWLQYLVSTEKPFG